MLRRVITAVSQLVILVLLSTCGYAMDSSLSTAPVASPVIQQFHSDIVVQSDGNLRVMETLRIVTDGVTIRHGIYRDFPKRQQQSFIVNAATLESKPVEFHTQTSANGIRIYLGSKNSYLPQGEYTYTLTYTVSGGVGFFNDHDELYWNVTGNNWNYAILQASATVYLPGVIANNLTGYTAYTGYSGSHNKYYTASLKQDMVFFQTTQPLAPQQGLTIVVGWHKGFIAAPKRLQEFSADNSAASLLVMWLGGAILCIYYLIVWFKYGRDFKLTIVPQYTPPADFSPAALRYILKMGYDDKAFAATILAMAVKGYLNIAQTEKFLGSQFSLIKRNDYQGELTDAETAIAKALFAESDTVVLNRHPTTIQIIRNAIQNFKLVLTQKFSKDYFVTNKKYTRIGALLSFALVGGVMLLNHQFSTISWFIFIGIMLIGETLTQIKSARTAIKTVIGLIVIGQFVMFNVHNSIINVTNVEFFIVLVVIHLIFCCLLPRDTVAGSKVVAAAKGFKMFLAATEKDQMNFRNPPAATPKLFEQYLPYALALGVEQQWSERFANQLAAVSYQPDWYQGGVGHTFTSASFSSMTNSFTNALNSASGTDSASGGSGFGGSSGGGGGGGGGGGW